MEALNIPPNSSRLYAYAVGMALLLALSALIMFSLEQVMMAQLRIATMVVAFVGCVLSGYGMMYFFLRAKQRPNILRAEQDGLQFDASFINRGYVRWANVQDYAIVKHAGRSVLLINLKDPFALIDAHSGLSRRLFKSNLKRYRSPVGIPVSLIEGDPVAVLKSVADFGRKVA